MKKTALQEKGTQNSQNRPAAPGLDAELRARLEALSRPLSQAQAEATKLSNEMMGLFKKIAVPPSGSPEEHDSGSYRKAITAAVAKMKDGGLLTTLVMMGDLYDQITRSVEESFPEILKALAETTGISIQGAFPDVFLDSLVALSVDTKKHIVSVDDDQYAVTEIIKALEKAVAQLRTATTTPFNGESFLTDIRSSYLEVAKHGGIPDGERAPVNAVLMTLALRRQKDSFRSDPSTRNFQGYGRTAFRRDLSRLLKQREMPMIDSKRLQLEPGSFSKEGIFMYVPTLGRCAFVSRIRFA